MKVAIVHYWLIGMRGGEKVLENICEIYPKADIFTHVYDKKSISTKINNHNIYTTFINHLPLSRKYYKYYLFLMPLALRLLNLKKYDLIISSESGPSKGITKSNNSFHICYCHTPMRYLWDFYYEYYNSLNILGKIGLSIFKKYLKKWDVRTASSLDLVISNSRFVSDRIGRCWNKKSFIVHPGIDFSYYLLSKSKQNFYLVISELVDYKRIDLVVDAFNLNKKEILIVGKGPLYNKLLNISNNNIKFLGWQTEEMKLFYLQNCKALIFPGIEDFGIVPLESMAVGKPVIAYKCGGVLDYLKEDLNGKYFNEQTTDSLNYCIQNFELNEKTFVPSKIRKSIKNFSNSNFKNKFKEIVDLQLKR
ncbi:MAG: glycosyl transferase [Candidatus Marinimicrobia bacterium]|nr:glycosyl transferase [Candidatus Neomarinimicrobiota bacterium]